MTDFEKGKEAISLLTWNIAKAYKLENYVGKIMVGKRANFVVYDGTPGTLEAKVRLVVDGEYLDADTEQF
jgi:imidazolonepropionase-like amidohydrolase